MESRQLKHRTIFDYENNMAPYALFFLLLLLTYKLSDKRCLYIDVGGAFLLMLHTYLPSDWEFCFLYEYN